MPFILYEYFSNIDLQYQPDDVCVSAFPLFSLPGADADAALAFRELHAGSCCCEQKLYGSRFAH